MRSEEQVKIDKYDVFMSYSRKDGAFARLLDKGLESYRPPRGLGFPQRRLNVFLDQEDIRGAEYFQTINGFLQNSEKLVLLCSPNSRRSKFVNDEVRRFAQARGAENIIPILVSGIPNNEAKPDQEDQMAFPESLCEVMEMPLATSYLGFNLKKDRVNKGVFYGSWYTTLANIYGVSRSEIEQRDKKRKNRSRTMIFGALIVIFAALSIALFVTIRARNNEARQRELAEASEKKAIQSLDVALKAQQAERQAREAEQIQRRHAEESAIEARKQRDIATDQRKEAIAQQKRAESALERASARLLTLQARDEIRKSAPRTLLLGAAAVEATAKQNYVEPSSEEFLRETLSQVHGRPLGDQKGDGFPVLYDISPDRRWVVTKATSKHPELWRLAAPGETAQKIHLDSIESPEIIRFSSNSKFLISCLSPLYAGAQSVLGKIASGDPGKIKEETNAGGQITLIPLATAERPATYKHIGIPAGSESIDNISFSPEGGFILVSMGYPDEKPARLYRVNEDGSVTNEVSLQIPNEKQYGSTPMWKFSPNGQWLVSYMRRAKSLLWDLRKGGIAGPYVLRSSSDLGDDWADFSDDMKWLVTSGYSDTAKLWSIDGETPAKTSYDLATGMNGSLKQVKFSPDGKWILAYPCLWSLETGEPSGKPIRLATSDDPIHWDTFDFTRNSRRLVMANMNVVVGVSVWDLVAPNPAKATINIQGKRELSVDRRWMIQIQSGRPARLWNFQDGPIDSNGSVELPGPPVIQALFAHDNSTLATSHADGSIRVHSIKGLDNIQTTIVRESGVPASRLQFSPKDGWLLATSYDFIPEIAGPAAPYLFKLLKDAKPVTIRLDDSKFNFVLLDGKKITDSSSSWTDFEFSPDERWLIAKQTLSPMAYIWNLRSEQISKSRQMLKGHEYSISYFDFVAEENALITTELYESGKASYRKRPRLWDLNGFAGGVYPLEASHPDRMAVWAKYSPDGELLATIGNEGTLVIYKIKDGALQAALTRKGMGKGVVHGSSSNGYSIWLRQPFAPQFDKTGRWLITASEDGQLFVIDCFQAEPKVHEIGPPLGKEPFVAIDGEKSLLVSTADDKSNQLEVWDLIGPTPKIKARIDTEWAQDINSYDKPEIRVTFVSRDEIAVMAPAKSGDRSEVWSYNLSEGQRKRLVSIPIERKMNVADEGYLLAGSQGLYNLHTRKALNLNGYIPHPQTYRKAHYETVTHFEYLVSPNGRWAIGRRHILEGHPEFGRKLHYAWRWIFDLHSKTPQKPVFELPEIQESIFAEFAGDSNHWVSVSESGQVAIVALPIKGAPRITTKKVDQYFSGRYVSALPLWPTGSVSYEVSISPKGDWLSTRRGDLVYLIRLNDPFEGKLLRGFEADRGFSAVNASFSANDDLALIGDKFWRTRLNADLLWPVSLGGNILAASANGEWIATTSQSKVFIHSMGISQLVEKARRMAGRDLTNDEKEQFLARP